MTKPMRSNIKRPAPFSKVPPSVRKEQSGNPLANGRKGYAGPTTSDQADALEKE